MRSVRIAIIGAGPSGLFFGSTIYELKAPVELSIFEQGPEAHLRCNEVKLDRTCEKCKICSVSNGIGGNALYRETRLSTKPAGSGLLSLLGSRYEIMESLALQKWVCGTGLSYSVVSKNYNKKNGYGALPLTRSQNCQLLDKLIKQVSQIGCIHCQQEVILIERHNEEWIVQTSKYSMKFDKIVIAGGKSCLLPLLPFLEKSGVRFKNSYFEYGCRIEFPSYPKSMASAAPCDNKLKVAISDSVSARTYCWSYPGRSIIIRNFGLLCLDGASEVSPSTQLSFAVLVRVKTSADEARQFLYNIRTKQEKLYNGFPIQEPFVSFFESNDLHDLKSRSIFKSGKQKDLFGSTLSAYLKSAISMLGINKWPGVGKAMILSPCIEKCTPVPVLNSNHESTSSGLFFIGDASGMYRGALQACISGVDCAKLLVES